MKRFAALLMATGLTACGSGPVIATVDTLCSSTSRYHATDAQITAFKTDQATWSSLVDWLASFNRVRDRRCFKAA